VIEIQESEVLSAAPDQAGKAHLPATAAPHSGAFLNVRPCSSIGTRLDSATLRIVVTLRLGAPVSSSVSPRQIPMADMFSAAGSPQVDSRDTTHSMTSSNELHRQPKFRPVWDRHLLLVTMANFQMVYK
jgi:hypothetical protein